MDTFADRLVALVKERGNPCVVGLDPRLDLMPQFVWAGKVEDYTPSGVRSAIAQFNRTVLDVVAPLVPAVKLQIAFYEQYGIPGLEAFKDTIDEAKRRGVLVIVDAKRNDIASTAEAYAKAFLAGSHPGTALSGGFDVDAITVSPFLGRDSLLPFVTACKRYGKGIFVLVKTSNPGSADIQDHVLADGRTLSAVIAGYVDELGREVVGSCGYSSVGAVVGATFPHQATELRALMPQAIILVPGYGAQGGTAAEAAMNFNADGFGAIVNASRSITYAFEPRTVSESEFRKSVKTATEGMIGDITTSLKASPER